ncbi:MAG: Hsp20/alpha crystallin family protein [Burkholderiaceae bacterium]|jgi:HSP20 family protein|nr:Hsp20/alpha crystallin family protein [Burkholderiaceae bacterium]MCZ8173737.1 Hsp20/alpha crystallin family protein [Burkholderiaceae bacterium]
MNELRLINDLFDFDPFESPARALLRPWRALADEPLAPTMRIDLADNGDAYLLKADIPGVAKDDIEVRIDGRQVTLSAEVKQEQTTQGNGGRTLRSERRHGFASRSLALDSAIDEGKAEAHYRNGVLELTLPKKGGTAGGRKLAIAG